MCRGDLSWRGQCAASGRQEWAPSPPLGSHESCVPLTFGERTTYATAAARCDALGEDTCPYTKVSQWDGCMNANWEVRRREAGGGAHGGTTMTNDGRRTTTMSDDEPRTPTTVDDDDDERQRRRRCACEQLVHHACNANPLALPSHSVLCRGGLISSHLSGGGGARLGDFGGGRQTSAGYFWTDESCSMRAQVDSDGDVNVVHAVGRALTRLKV